MITVLIGVSGSGKTTEALKLLSENPNMIRVNRDDIRKVLFGVEQTDKHYYERKDLKRCEKRVTDISEQIIYDALNDNKDIVLDNTNLDVKYINEIIDKFNHLSTIELIFLHQTGKDELEIFRQRLLERYDGDIEAVKYLDKQWRKFENLLVYFWGKPLLYMQTAPKIRFNPDEDKTYIFDLDGTICDNIHRSPFDESKVTGDKIIEPVAIVAKGIDALKNTVIYVSGRTNECYDDTKTWLQNNGLWFENSELFMRKKGDSRPDYIVKEEIITKIADKYNVIGVVDDRLSVSRTYFKLGLFTFNVNQNFKIF